MSNNETADSAEGERSGVVPPASAAPLPDGSKDPLRIMVEIAKDPDLTPQDKTNLIGYSRERFTHRRRMAYMALYTVIGSIVFLGAAALLDGLSGESQILDKVKDNQGLIGSIIGFLTGIVGAYYGVSAWRPSS